jgi:hypothetical protein
MNPPTLAVVDAIVTRTGGTGGGGVIDPSFASFRPQGAIDVRDVDCYSY